MSLNDKQYPLFEALTKSCHTSLTVSEMLELSRAASLETIKKQGFQTVNITNAIGENVRFDFDRVASNFYKLERQTDSMDWRKLAGFISLN